jgi:hypothetical protein
MYYIMDTNIWVEVIQGTISCDQLCAKPHLRVVVAPFMIVELMKATVKNKGKYFVSDQKMFRCMAKFDILELTKPLLFKILWNISEAGVSKVRPDTYKSLLKMMLVSKTFNEFISKTEAPDSMWNKVSDWGLIHEGVLDKESDALGKLARGGSVLNLHTHVAQLYRVGGLMPDPDTVETLFSAGLEYLRSNVMKVRNGANPKRNDRGMYVDSQMFYYLADPEAVIVTNEDFSTEIAKSPQKSRIISFEEFLSR